MEIHTEQEKGFTLAELLIVAIVSILTAISIPIFTRQLETSRRAAWILPMSVLHMQRLWQRS